MTEQTLSIAAAFVALLALISIRVPIGLSLITVSFFGIAYETSFRAAIGSIGRLPFDLSTNWNFSSVPMFLFMGFLAAESGLTKGLFSASRVLLRRLPGVLACSSVLASALFAAASGSSVATAAAMSKIAIPEMLRHKYDPGLASGAVAASGTLGSLIPPSILMILYGIYADVSIGGLFLAGVVPGILSVALYMGMIVLRCTLSPKLAGETLETANEPDLSLKDLFIAIMPLPILIVVVMGSISAGIATPTEAGALGALGALLLVIATGRFEFACFWQSAKQTALSFTAIFIIVVGGALLTRYVAVAGVSSLLRDMFAGLDSGPLVLLLAITILYIVLGMFIDTIGLLLLTAPLVVPIAGDLGMDLIWFGIILIKLLEIGLITPPVGLNIFVIHSSLRGQIDLSLILRGVVWFIAMDLLTLALLIAFPAITLWLPASVL